MNADELLIRIDERVLQLQKDLAELSVAMQSRLNQQELRIDGMPQWKHVSIAGGSGIIALLGSVIKMLWHRGP